MGNLVADSLLDSLSSEDRGGAEIGVVNPGGLRAEFCKTGDNEKCTIAADGTITYAQANAVLPFLNNLWTTTLTGAQFKEALEQQWQTDADGNVPSARTCSSACRTTSPTPMIRTRRRAITSLR